MELSHNEVIRLLDDGAPGAYATGLYRVVFDEPVTRKVVAVCLDLLDKARSQHGGRRELEMPKNLRKKKPLPLVGDLLWLDYDTLEAMYKNSCLHRVVLELDSVYFLPLNDSNQSIFDRRVNAMANFLDFDHMKESIIVHHGLGGLVKDAMDTAGVSSSFVYVQWSTLCRLGFSAASLRPRRDRCGAPGLRRPCEPGGRKKAGRKTIGQQIDAKFGPMPEPRQPGMCEAWRTAILAADRTLKGPLKPAMRARYEHIVNSAFVSRYKEKDGQLIRIEPAIGTYPNIAQVRRVLTREIPALERLLQKTTTGYFNRNMRGLKGTNRDGVAGPGHTWAIDSTIGDIYLRSSIDRAWIIGRPVVYVIVDVWSTAVVGFYVCLTGPSWDTARISLFNCLADPALQGDLLGFEPIVSLVPTPTICYALMCDRGEYLSKKASFTAAKLIDCMSYAPPYRPDLKGLVEVLHRIAKDAQYLFVPGAINQRRKEYELRKFRPQESIYTIQQYIQHLHVVFSKYNLTADRSNRVDAHMAAQGVVPSPAGLWHWGHQVGIGFRKVLSEAELVTSLLDAGKGHVGRSSVKFTGIDYMSKEVAEAHWTTIARNYGGWDIPVHYHPGSVNQIWTPNPGAAGLLRLGISDQANTAAGVSFAERSDAFMFAKANNAQVTHERLKKALELRDRLETIRDEAQRLTAEALKKASGAMPTMREARMMEQMISSQSSGSAMQGAETVRDEALNVHLDMMNSIFEAMNE